MAVTVDEFKVLSIMPSEDIDGLEETSPGFVSAQLRMTTSWVYSRLRKRYRVPFADPVPDVVKEWIARIAAPRCYTKRGWVPTASDIEAIKKDGEDAKEEVKEAADAVEGLFDLPLLDSGDASAISKQTTRSYSEQSPYVGFSRQRETGRDEDRNGGGTFL